MDLAPMTKSVRGKKVKKHRPSSMHDEPSGVHAPPKPDESFQDRKKEEKNSWLEKNNPNER
jgi:hypothetical protein